MNSREQFEKWALERYGVFAEHLEQNQDGYIDEEIDGLWTAYSAAWRELEAKLLRALEMESNAWKVVAEQEELIGKQAAIKHNQKKEHHT